MRPISAKNGNDSEAIFEEPKEPLEVDEIPDSAIKTLHRPPRIGIVFGPGGLRAFAHAGFISAVAKSGLQPVWISGIEMGALPGALWAQNGQPFDAEWQMSKLQESEFQKSGILSGPRRRDIRDLRPKLQELFKLKQLKDFKFQFVCPATSSRQNRSLILTRGAAVDVLTYCLPHEPLLTPLPESQAFPLSLKDLTARAKANGVELLIYIDLMHDLPAAESVSSAWGLIRQGLNDQTQNVDHVIKIPARSGFTDFSSRAELIRLGGVAGEEFVKWLKERNWL